MNSLKNNLQGRPKNAIISVHLHLACHLYKIGRSYGFKKRRWDLIRENMKTIQNILTLYFLALIFSPVIAGVDQPEASVTDSVKSAQIPIYKKISKENLKSLDKEDVSSDTGTLNALINDEKDFIDVVREKVDAQFNLDPHTKRHAVFALLNKYEESHPLPILEVLEDGTWKDLEIICGPKTKPDLYLASKIDRTVTEVGRAMLFRKIIQPTDNLDELVRQQKIVKTLVEDENLFNDLDVNLKKLAIPESVFLSFWGEDILSSLMKQSKFSLPLENKIERLKDITTWINKNEHLLMAISVSEEAFFLLSLSMLICTSITIPADWAADKLGHPLPFNDKVKKFNEKCAPPKELSIYSFTGMMARGIGFFCGDNEHFKQAVSSLAFCFAVYGAWRMARWFYEGQHYGAMIQKKLAHLATYVDSLDNMIQLIKKQEAICKLMPQIAILDEKIEALRILHEDFDHLLDLLKTSTFKGEHSYFSFWSRMSVAYRLMEQEKEKFDEIMMAIGELDAQMSIARFYKEMKNKRVECCFPEYITGAELPFLNIDDFWHPNLDIDKVVANSINIHGKNIVITGPNAGGKSTIMKGLVISIIMAQALGIAPAKKMCFSPFSKIITYMNITDDIAAGNSHFKAGVIRARDVINEFAKIKDGQHAIALIDEVFNGTTFSEGQAAAYSFINQLGQDPGNVIITTTHFPMMAGLAKISDRFVNYKVYVNYDQNGKIIYPYKLEPGVSDQVVTLKILREEGFADKFIDDAENVLSIQAAY